MRTSRISEPVESLGEQDWETTDFQGRAIGVRLVRERFTQVADPAGTYISYTPGKYVTLLAYTTRNGKVSPKSAPRVMREFKAAVEAAQTETFYKLVEASKERAKKK